MAKVMVSLPDELLREVDSEAERRGTTRSGLLRAFAEAEFRRRSALRAERMARLAAGSPAQRRGGNVADVVKASRPQR